MSLPRERVERPEQAGNSDMKTSTAAPRNRRRIMRLSPIFIGLLLSGCASIKVPEKLRDLEIPANDAAFRTRVYAGATLGNSHLTPKTAGTAFNVDNKNDLGSQLRLGVDIHNMLSVEIETSVLGTATLREAGTDVSYSAASVNALVYGLNGVQSRSRREGWSAYGRLGMGVVKRSSAVIALDEGGSSPIIGAGAEFGFPNGLGIRGEIVRFDGDAVYAGIGAVYRFGLSPGQIGNLLAEAAEPALASQDRRVAAGGRLLKSPGRPGAPDMHVPGDSTVASSGRGGEPSLGAASGFRPGAVSGVPRWRAVVHKDDHDRDGVRNIDDFCADTGRDIIVDEQGCGLFDELLADVIFKSGSHYLTARARGQLDEVAKRLLNFPEARVRVVAHTDATGPADANLALSARRAESVVQYLQTRYVRELQLEALGAGEARPLASNRTAEGRKRNRRVELETVASLSDEQLAESLESSDVRGEERWLPPLPGAATTAARTANNAKASAPVDVVAKATSEEPVNDASETAQVADAAPLGPDAVRVATTPVPAVTRANLASESATASASASASAAVASPRLGAAAADLEAMAKAESEAGMNAETPSVGPVSLDQARQGMLAAAAAQNGAQTSAQASAQAASQAASQAPSQAPAQAPSQASTPSTTRTTKATTTVGMAPATDATMEDDATGKVAVRENDKTGTSSSVADTATAKVKPDTTEKVAASTTPASPAGQETPAAALPSRAEPLPRPAVVEGLDIDGVLEGVSFDKGSAALSSSARPYLAHVAAELRRYPSARVAIMAHTDNEGSEHDNQRLSRRRAEAVLEHLVEMGIGRSRLQAEGYGETLPLAQNVTAADRARNRRIELRLLADVP